MLLSFLYLVKSSWSCFIDADVSNNQEFNQYSPNMNFLIYFMRMLSIVVSNLHIDICVVELYLFNVYLLYLGAKWP